MSGLVTLNHTIDEHVSFLLKCEGRPLVNLDISNTHGRRTLGVRVDGMSILSVLLDVESVPPAGREIQRFCPYCGVELDLTASIDRHECKADTAGKEKK